MFDQSLSVKNFRIIYELDRKNNGRIEKDYFPVAFQQRLKIRNLKKIAKNLGFRYKKKLVSKEHFEIRRERANKLIELRKEILNNEVNKILTDVVKTVSAKGYSLPLTKSDHLIREKEVFSIGNDIETIFVSRHVQMVLSSLYKVKINNRDLIISRLSTIVKDSSPKYIIRADVEGFYESIDHKDLLDILHSSPKLSVTPRRILTQLIRAYAKISNKSKGLPRGVGISAYLSEVYMGNVDEEINSLPDVTYYERYVDDLIAIFSPTRNENLAYYLPSIGRIISKKKLQLNDKTKELDLFNQKSNNFEYLGYHFRVENGSCTIKLSHKKKDKIKERINQSFNYFHKEHKGTPRAAFRNLLLRIRFLTGNTRLLNSKSNAFVGIYFSNKFINDTSDLVALDNFLEHKLNSLPNSKHRNRIKKMSFVQGFENKIFRKFDMKELSLVSKGWNNG